ncbi:hypothetical protein CHUV0807_0712 [Cardiobacterium hominis]|uniref:Uncharacterized protein n=1 Tax=Cardiobacterium hominis TaxID=2718 RepID=A0A1C3H341_9GAMM|nr:hypothetical protein CHUV0807_0712 [Cardiobacterium hominis]
MTPQADKQAITHEPSPKSTSLTRRLARHNKSLPAAVETVQWRPQITCDATAPQNPRPNT